MKTYTYGDSKCQINAAQELLCVLVSKDPKIIQAAVETAPSLSNEDERFLVSKAAILLITKTKNGEIRLTSEQEKKIETAIIETWKMMYDIASGKFMIDPNNKLSYEEIL